MKLVRTAAVVCAAACALTACHPAHQHDSDEFVDTATGVAAPTAATSASATDAEESSSTSTVTVTTSTSGSALATEDIEGAPGYIDCVGAPTQKPEIITFTCADAGDQLQDIEWDKWDKVSATGTAVRVTEGVRRNVDVELTKPIESPQGVVFSQVQVDGSVVPVN